MFQFARCPDNSYFSVFWTELSLLPSPDIIGGGLPHSETAGSQAANRLTDDIVGIQTSFLGQNRQGIRCRLYE